MHQHSHYQFPRGDERKKGPEKIFEEIVAENFLNLGNDTVYQVQEAQRVPCRINPRRTTPRHIVIKPKIKDRDKILKATREKQQITYKGTPSRLSTDFTIETLKTRKEWHDIFKVIKGKNLKPRILYPERPSFRFDGEIKFSRQAKVKRIQHHQTSFTTNARGTSLCRKHKGRKRFTENKPRTSRKL